MTLVFLLFVRLYAHLIHVGSLSWWAERSHGVQLELPVEELMRAVFELVKHRGELLRCCPALLDSVKLRLSSWGDEIPDHDLPECVEALEQMSKELGQMHQRDIVSFLVQWQSLRDRKCFVCPVCRTWCGLSHSVQCSRQHRVCKDCMRGWANQFEQLQPMILSRTFALPCFCFSGATRRCRGKFPEEALRSLARCNCADRRTCSCSKLEQLCRDFQIRKHVQQNAGWSRRLRGQVVECPEAGCVGLAYTETGRAMCFVCEHQWEVEETDASFRRWACSCARRMPASEQTVPSGCKRCPSCKVLIEKNGGCDHMACKCGHHFWWSSLRPFRWSW